MMEVGDWWRRGKWRIMVMLTMLHIVGILIFTRGFLLTRTELPYYSNCSDVSESPCFTGQSNPYQNQSNSHCWTRPAVDRLVIIVLDALRFDFVAPSTFFKESKPWMDKLRVLQKLASTKTSARIFKAIADPPTTSLQRLKGLTTGGLPTFIDVGNSFGAPAILEDNLIHQLASNGKRVVMMGDDTWVQLFPHHFKKSYPYPSFNVKGLHTVDNGCIEHLLPSLYEEDWDVLIAHFLGVDHAGHILGVDSVPMIEKLEQYTEILDKVIEVLDNQSGPGGLHENTFLLVMGDHGQTINGDHGGGSAEEVETSVFAMRFKNLHPPCHLNSILHLVKWIWIRKRHASAPSNSLILQQQCQPCLVSPFLLEVLGVSALSYMLWVLVHGIWRTTSREIAQIKKRKNGCRTIATYSASILGR